MSDDHFSETINAIRECLLDGGLPPSKRIHVAVEMLDTLMIDDNESDGTQYRKEWRYQHDIDEIE